MTTAPYNKAPLDYAAQLALLESRGLKVTDQPFALHCLEQVNYYRLSAYRFPLTVQGNPDQFLTGVTFTDLWTLYDFDQKLRRLVMDGCKRVEVSIRAHWAYHLGHTYGAFCYEDSSIFQKDDEHLRGLGKIYNDLANSKEDFVKHFKVKYGLTRPPVWAMCEILSFGQISRFYKNLKKPADRQAIALPFGVDEKILVSYLEHLTVVRNTAAHHARLWNRHIGVTFIIPNKPVSLHANFTNATADQKKLYNTLTMLLHLLAIIEPKCPVGPALHQTINGLDAKYHSHMGFPVDWKNRALWKAIAPPPPPSLAHATSTP